MSIANIREAESQLADLVDRALQGEEVIIARDGTPVVRLMPILADETPRQGGQWQGQIRMAPDFDRFPADLAAAFGVEPS